MDNKLVHPNSPKLREILLQRNRLLIILSLFLAYFIFHTDWKESATITGTDAEERLTDFIEAFAVLQNWPDFETDDFTNQAPTQRPFSGLVDSFTDQFSRLLPANVLATLPIDESNRLLVEPEITFNYIGRYMRNHNNGTWETLSSMYLQQLNRLTEAFGPDAHLQQLNLGILTELPTGQGISIIHVPMTEVAAQNSTMPTQINVTNPAATVQMPAGDHFLDPQLESSRLIFASYVSLLIDEVNSTSYPRKTLYNVRWWSPDFNPPTINDVTLDITSASLSFSYDEELQMARGSSGGYAGTYGIIQAVDPTTGMQYNATLAVDAAGSLFITGISEIENGIATAWRYSRYIIDLAGEDPKHRAIIEIFLQVMDQINQVSLIQIG